jgi:Ni,Fe-hydrogenase maturation factor
VDASHQTTNNGIEVVPIAPQADGTSVTHHFSPEGLLLMAQQLYGHCPSAWCIYIPARSFELGAEMTKDVADCVQDALRIIMNFIGSFGYIPDED